MINKTSIFLVEHFVVRRLFDYVVRPSFIQITFWLINTSKFIFILKPDNGFYAKLLLLLVW